MKKILFSAAALLVLLTGASAAPPLKTRRQLKMENQQLRSRLDDARGEILRLRGEIKQRDSLFNMVEGPNDENENKSSFAMSSPSDYQASTDSLLSVWYLQRQARENREGTGYNMDSVKFNTSVPDSVLVERLQKMNSFITLPYNETVKNYMILYSEKMPVRMCQLMGLANYYMPIFEESFLRYGLPVELKYLAIIESALNPVAVSPVGATGMWQFMYHTALNYGLKIDSYIDERRDPYKSADAAARYLRDAYRVFGDWNLVISSYNCGSGNVNKAIRRAGGSRDFWSIYQYLPRETRGYVPAMVGAMYALNYAREYGLEAAAVNIPAHIDTFSIHRNLHFRQISEVLGIPMEDLRDLNPQYYKDIVPGAQGEMVLRLPFEFSSAFLEKEDAIYAHKADEIFSAGSVDVDRRPAAQQSASAPATGSPQYYKVKRGDNLGSIAKKHHTTVAKLKKLNNLKSDMIREGQRLRVR